MTQLLTPCSFKDAASSPWFRAAEGTCGFVQWRQMTEEFRAGKYLAWRFQNGPQGLVIARPEGGRLFIFYLTGKGILRKRSEIARQLYGISKSLGLNGLSGCAKDERRAKFFRGAGGTVLNERRRIGESFFDLEYG